MKNPIESTNDYLEFLAGRQPQLPILPPGDEDVLEASNVLRALRQAAPNPAFQQQLKQRVLPGAKKSLSAKKSPAARPPRESQPRHWLFRFAVPALAVAAVAGVAFLVPPSFWIKLTNRSTYTKYVAQEAQAAVITLTASKEDVLGVDADTKFVLKAKDGTLTAADVKANFALSPAVDFDAKEQGANTVEITLKQPLASQTVYTATYQGVAKTETGGTTERTYSWAYQVRNTFQIIGTLPRNQATGVVPETGIEVTFSASGVSAKDFQSHFEISPKTAGRIEVHNRTLVFVPDKKLKDKTLYTATVKSGLKPEKADQGLANDYVFQFEVAGSPPDQAETFARIRPRNVFESVRPDEPLVFAGGAVPFIYNEKSGTSNPQNYDFTVYKYADLNAFVTALEEYQKRVVPWSMFANQAVTYSTAGLTKVGVYKTKSEAGMTMLGMGFSQGFYLADSTSNGTHSQIPFLVSTIGAYSLATKTDTLVWINDLDQGSPVNGAEITLRGTSTKLQTNQDGTATFTTPDGLRQNRSGIVFATVRANSQDTVILINGNRYYGFYGYGYGYMDIAGLAPASDKFWSYLSTDRDIYQPNDTVRFWGILKRRDNPKPSENLKLELVQRNYEGRYSTEILKSVELTTTATGTFMGSLELKDVPTTGYPELVLTAGEWVASKSFSVDTYKKPPYQITVKPDRYAVITGETVNYDVTTTFFDGTPVANVGLRLEQNFGASQPDLTTDAEGKATYSQKLSDGDYASSYLSFVPFEQFEGDIRGSTYVTVYPARFQIEAQGSVDGSNGTVSGTVRNIHPELADPSADDPLAKVIGEPRPNQKLTGKLIAIISDKVSDGTTYDFLAKRTVEQYHYTTRDEERQTFTVTTDRNGKFSKTFTLDPKLFYRVELVGTDQLGNTANATAYLWSRGSYVNPYGAAGAELSLVDLNQGANQPSPSYAVGDEVKLQLNRGSEQISKDVAKSVMFITSQRGLRKFVIRQTPTYSFTFADSDLPALSTRAVVFTGTGYAEVTGPVIDFNESTRALKINLTPDNPSYRPGDTVNLKVNVTDQDGQGVSARVNLSGVDEAVVALQGQRYGNDPLTSLYRWVDDGVLGSYASHEEVKTALGAERGGGGGDRIDFRDNAVYTEIETDVGGNGATTFKLPDNLTSWRITAQAVSDNLQAGTKDRLVVVQKPLFVVTSFSDRMLNRDSQKLAATAFGTALKAGDGVEFTFSLPDVPGTEVVKSGQAFQSISFDLPKLEVGDYRVRVSVSAKGQSDAVVEPLHVVSSNHVQRTVTTAMLEKNESPVFAPSGRTQLRIGDADRNLAYELLWGLLWNPYSRLDDTVAGRIAVKILKDEFGDEAWTSPGDPKTFLTDKGLALYAIGSEDLEYGSLAAADSAFADNRSKLVTWFQRTVDDPKSNTEQVAYALYGLAQLKEPVLPEVRALLAVEGLPDREKLTLALALEALGAKDEARPIASYLLATYGERQQPYVRLKLGANDDERIVETARVAILAAGLNLDEQYGLLQYLEANPPRDTTTHLEAALAIERLLAHAPSGEVSVTYTLNGKSETKRLSKKEALTLSLDMDEAKTFSITAHTGNVSVVSTFSQAFDPAQTQRDPNLNLKRVYKLNGKETTTFKRGDLVKVELSWSKKSGALGKNFGIVDLLPTGLRVVSNPWLFDRSQNVFYPYDVEHNRVKFYAWDKPFYYYARAVVSGTVVAEPATVQAFDAPQNVQYSDEANLTIQ